MILTFGNSTCSENTQVSAEESAFIYISNTAALYTIKKKINIWTLLYAHTTSDLPHSSPVTQHKLLGWHDFCTTLTLPHQKQGTSHDTQCQVEFVKMSQSWATILSLYHNEGHVLQTQACIPVLQHLQDTKLKTTLTFISIKCNTKPDK